MPFASGNCIYHARLAATSGTGMRPRCPTSSTCVKTPALGPVLDYGKVPPDLKAGDQGLYFRRGSGKSRPRGLGIFFPTKLVRVGTGFSSLIRFNALEKKNSGVAKPRELKKLKRNTKTSTTRSTGYTVQNELAREKPGAPEENLFLIRNVTIVPQFQGSELACRIIQLLRQDEGGGVEIPSSKKSSKSEKILVHPFSCFPLVMPIRIARSMKRLCTILVLSGTLFR